MWGRVPSWVLAFILVGMSCVGGVAADSVRELPLPAELPLPGSLMLHGGGRVTIEAFDSFVNLAGGPEAKIVVIPSAGYRASDYDNLERFTSAINRSFRTWTNLPSRGRAS